MLGLDWWHLYLYIIGLLPMLASIENDLPKDQRSRGQVVGYYSGQLIVGLLWPVSIPVSYAVQGLSNYRVVHKSVLDKSKPPT